MARTRREFLRLAGSATGIALAAGCDAVAVQPAADPQAASAGAQDGSAGPAETGTASAPAAGLPPATTSTSSSPGIAALQSYLQAHASSIFALPPPSLSIPVISWAGPLTGSSAATSLPNGVVIPITSTLISRAIPALYSASLPGNPSVQGHPCLAVSRPYTCKGIARAVGSVRALRVNTDAPVLELTGVIADGSQTVQTVIVDGQLVPAKVLSSWRATGGWNVGTVRIAFGTRQMRDIWIETGMFLAYVKVDQADSVVAPEDSAEPQLTVVGDSYQQANSATFGNGGAFALELAARLGIRKVATDAIGGTGYWNSGLGLGNLNDRLPAHALDNSTIYLIAAGLNDYGDQINSSTVAWPSTAVFNQAVLGYLQALRARQPNALIVVTAPFCPNPTLSDASYVAHPATNNSGMGDFLYKASLFKSSLQKITAPWVYVDALMGTGWLNSSGASGEVRNLQWLTGGTPAPGTSATYKPGNTNGGGGGGFGGIAAVPVLAAGHYSQAPEVSASGGSGSGLLLSSRIDASGALTAINVVVAGKGYSAGAGLPVIAIDRTFQSGAATLGTPTLLTGINPTGAYPMSSLVAEGVSDLNNIYRMLGTDETHPSPLGVEYLATRLALNVFQAVMAL